jgi:hypothetical protein
MCVGEALQKLKDIVPSIQFCLFFSPKAQIRCVVWWGMVSPNFQLDWELQ